MPGAQPSDHCLRQAIRHVLFTLQCIGATPRETFLVARCLNSDFVCLTLFSNFCKASCALEFELDLVQVYMDMEDTELSSVKDGSAGKSDSPEDPSRSRMAHKLGQQNELQAFLSALSSAASRAKRRACRQDRERVISDAGFDPTLSSKWVVVSEEGQLVSSAADNGHSHSLVRQCLRRGTWSWELALERESSGDETTCVGVAVNPVTNSCYEDSHQASNIDSVDPPPRFSRNLGVCGTLSRNTEHRIAHRLSFDRATNVLMR